MPHAAPGPEGMTHAPCSTLPDHSTCPMQHLAASSLHMPHAAPCPALPVACRWLCCCNHTMHIGYMDNGALHVKVHGSTPKYHRIHDQNISGYMENLLHGDNAFHATVHAAGHLTAPKALVPVRLRQPNTMQCFSFSSDTANAIRDAMQVTWRTRCAMAARGSLAATSR